MRILSERLLNNITNTNHVRAVDYSHWAQSVIEPSSAFFNRQGLNRLEWMKERLSRGTEFLFVSESRWDWRYAGEVLKSVFKKVLEMTATDDSVVEFNFGQLSATSSGWVLQSGDQFMYRLEVRYIDESIVYVFYKVTNYTQYDYLFHIIPVYDENLVPTDVTISKELNNYLQSHITFNIKEAMSKLKDITTDLDEGFNPDIADDTETYRAYKRLIFYKNLRNRFRSGKVLLTTRMAGALQSFLDTLLPEELRRLRTIAPITFVKSFPLGNELDNFSNQVNTIINQQQGDIYVKVA